MIRRSLTWDEIRLKSVRHSIRTWHDTTWRRSRLLSRPNKKYHVFATYFWMIKRRSFEEIVGYFKLEESYNDIRSPVILNYSDVFLERICLRFNILKWIRIDNIATSLLCDVFINVNSGSLLIMNVRFFEEYDSIRDWWKSDDGFQIRIEYEK